MSRLKNTTQIIRKDGKDCFLEITVDCLKIDKIMLQAVSYDQSRPAGQRETGKVPIYLDIFMAARIGQDILSGRYAALAQQKRKEAEASGSKYPSSVIDPPIMGGTSGARTADHKPIARQMRLIPGNIKPWIIEVTSGPGKEIGKGLIAPDGKPTTVIRVPLTNDDVKEIALALQYCDHLWMSAKFGGIVGPMMDEQRKAAMTSRYTQPAAEEDDNIPPELPFD